MISARITPLLLAAFSLALAAPAAQAKEPAMPAALGRTYSITLPKPESSVLFRIRLPHPGQLFLNAAPLLRRQTLQAIVFDEKTMPVGTLSCTSTSIGQASNRTVLHLPAGTYTVRIGSANTTAAKPLEVSLHLRANYDPHEPNDTLDQAKPAPLGHSFPVILSSKQDHDFFHVDAPADGYLQIAAHDPDREINTRTLRYRFYNSAGKRIGPDNQTAIPAARVAKGRVTIEIYTTTTPTRSIGDVNITILFTPAPDNVEPNNTWQQAEPLPLDQQVRTTPFPAYDQEWFALSIPKKGILSIYLEQTSGAPVKPGTLVAQLVKKPAKKQNVTTPVETRRVFPAAVLIADKGDYLLSLHTRRAPAAPRELRLWISLADENEKPSINLFIIGLGGTPDFNAYLKKLNKVGNGTLIPIDDNDKEGLSKALANLANQINQEKKQARQTATKEIHDREQAEIAAASRSQTLWIVLMTVLTLGALTWAYFALLPMLRPPRGGEPPAGQSSAVIS